jgi:fluoroacetyl-CoA thioesterase
MRHHHYNDSVAAIPIGTKGEKQLPVTSEITVSFLGPDSPHVLGTPFMILYMEYTARDSVLPFLEPGFDTVGTLVNIRHLAATPLGMQVTFRSELLAMDDRRLTFRVEAFDEKEKIGEGTHERAVVNIAKFKARLDAKGRG